jgi:hypothetical protein
MNAKIKQAAVLAGMVLGSGLVVAGCLTRPVATAEPITQTNFTSTVQNQVIDKVDILFDIDNSASMGDKQNYLIQAIPDLIGRLLTPDCLDVNMVDQGQSTMGANGTATRARARASRARCTPGRSAAAVPRGRPRARRRARAGDRCCSD